MILVWRCNFWYHPDIDLSDNYHGILIKRSRLCCYMELGSQFVTSQANCAYFFLLLLLGFHDYKDKNQNTEPLFDMQPQTLMSLWMKEAPWWAQSNAPRHPHRSEVSTRLLHLLISISSPSISSREMGGWVSGGWGGDLPFLLRELRTTQQNSKGRGGGRGALGERKAAASAAGAPQSLSHRWWEEVPLQEERRAGGGGRSWSAESPRP